MKIRTGNEAIDRCTCGDLDGPRCIPCGRPDPTPRRYKGATAPALELAGARVAWDAWADELARTVRAAITESRVCVAELARVTGLSIATLHRMGRVRGAERRRGRMTARVPTMRNLYLTARALGLPVSSLLPGGDQ